MSPLTKTAIKEFLISLSHQERALFKHYTGYLPSSTPASRTMLTAGANLIPQGHYQLAEKSLLKGIELAKSPEEKARLHLNLAQLYADLFEITAQASYRRQSTAHCQQCLELGFFTDFIAENFPLASHVPLQ